MNIITSKKAEYERWVEDKMSKFTNNLDDLFVEIANQSSVSKAEISKIKNILSQQNICFFELKNPNMVKKINIRDFVDAVGMKNFERCNTSDDLDISEISDKQNQDAIGEYVPYTNKALNWHTDGYYNPIQSPVLSWMLYCANPAIEGGVNKFLDHEIIYILLNQLTKEIESLMDNRAYCIPKNEGVGRPDEYGYVFNFIREKLHMRFTMRMKNIIWKNEIIHLVTLLRDIIKKSDNYQIIHKLQNGQGIFSNNVLHMRSSFTNNRNENRLLLRMRAKNRII